MILELACFNGASSPNNFANLISPVTNLGGPVYEAEVWSNSNVATEVTFSPIFGSGFGGNRLTFDLFIPNTVTIVTSGTTTAPAKNTPINGRWDGNVGVYQNNVGYSIQFTQFTTDDGYFN